MLVQRTIHATGFLQRRPPALKSAALLVWLSAGTRQVLHLLVLAVVMATVAAAAVGGL
jgi:hypothetical protein